MDLFESMTENEYLDNNKKKKKNKMPVIIISIIIVLLIFIIAIIGGIIYLKSSQMKFYVDGVQQTINTDYFKIEENGKIYISIQDMAQVLKVQYFNGEYGRISEDSSKGYITFETEIVTFEANSNKIYKIDTNSNQENYSYMYLDENIKFMNGKLYTTPDGITKILNVSFSFNKNVNISSLQYLNDYYTEIIANYGYKQISEEYNNQKALKNDILIVKNENNKTRNNKI